MIEQVIGTAEAADHAGETLCRRAGVQRALEPPPRSGAIGSQPAEHQQLRAQRQGHLQQSRVGRLAAQQCQRLMDLQRVARRARQWLGHAGDQGRAAQPCRRGHADQRFGQFPPLFEARHDRAIASLDVEDQRLEPGSKFLGEDRRGDQRHAVDRRGDVADGVQAAIRRRDPLARADDRHAGVADHAAQPRGVRLHRVARYRLELVERTAGMPEAAAGDHRYEASAGSEHRPERQRHQVAHAAGRVLVEHRTGQIVRAPVEHRAAVTHRKGELGALRRRHAAKEHGHRERGGLGIGQAAIREPARQRDQLGLR